MKGVRVPVKDDEGFKMHFEGFWGLDWLFEVIILLTCSHRNNKEGHTQHTQLAL